MSPPCHFNSIPYQKNPAFRDLATLLERVVYFLKFSSAKFKLLFFYGVIKLWSWIMSLLCHLINYGLYLKLDSLRQIRRPFVIKDVA